MVQKSVTSKCRSTMAIFLAFAMVAIAVFGTGAISFQAQAITPTADVSFGLEPTYRDATYTLDPVLTLQRMDATGLWTVIGASNMTDSTLVLNNGDGLNLTLAKNAYINDGTFYEMRCKASALTANTTLKLYSSGTAYVSIGLGVSGQIVARWYNASAHASSNLGAYVANTYVKIAVLYENSVWKAAAYYDNGTMINKVTCTAAALSGPANVSQIIIASSAAPVGTVDYMYQTSGHTDYVPASTSTSGVNVATTQDKDYLHMKVDFSAASQQPGTYSDNPAVHTYFGDTIVSTDASALTKLNLTDFADQLAATKEDNTPVTGIAKMHGWDNVQADSETQLQAYLADRHSVPVTDLTVIDYYITDVKGNYSWSKSMEDKVQAAWLDSIQENAEEYGAVVTYSDGKTNTAMEMSPYLSSTGLEIKHEATDVKSVDVSALTNAQYQSFREAVSTHMREKTIGLAMIAPENPENMTHKSFIGSAGGLLSISSLDANGLSVASSSPEGIDTSYQYTDAALGKMMAREGYMKVDVDQVSTDQKWSSVSSGKMSAAPLTSVTLIGSNIVSYLLIIVFVILIIVVVMFFLVWNKKKNRKSGSKN